METHEVVEEPPGEARAQPAPLHRAEREVMAPDHQISCSPGGHASCLCMSPGCCWQAGAESTQLPVGCSAPWTGSSQPVQSLCFLSHIPLLPVPGWP